MSRAAAASRTGSNGSAAVGRPVAMSQKPHARVQTSPRRRNVAVPREKHSPRLGQRASSQTVESPCERATLLTE